MLQFDHLVVVAPSLEEGSAHIRDQLGVELPYGGKHAQMGTHNLLGLIGPDVFLEVIAVDPTAPTPTHARWFGLSNEQQVARDWQTGRRLRAWVANISQMDLIPPTLRQMFGAPQRLTRGDLSWLFCLPADGMPILGGALPYIIDWQDAPKPSSRVPEVGLRLRDVCIETPDVALVSQVLSDLQLANGPRIVAADRVCLSATLATPLGERTLT